MGHMEDEAQPNPIGPTPWRFFGDFLGVQKVTRRRSGETSPCDRQMKRRRGTSPHPTGCF